MLNFTGKTIPLPREEAEEYNRWKLLLSNSQRGTFTWQLQPNEVALLLTTHPPLASGSNPKT
jgi:hypothetical protein